MQRTKSAQFVCLLVASLSTLSILAGCALEQAVERDEVIAGITLPIPGGMSKAEGKTIELMMPGFEGSRVAYQGRLAPEEVVGFYKKAMTARGWKPNASFVRRGGLLVYSKDNSGVLITVGQGDDDTSLAILVGTLAFHNNP